MSELSSYVHIPQWDLSDLYQNRADPMIQKDRDELEKRWLALDLDMNKKWHTFQRMIWLKLSKSTKDFKKGWASFKVMVL